MMMFIRVVPWLKVLFMLILLVSCHASTSRKNITDKKVQIESSIVVKEEMKITSKDQFDRIQVYDSLIKGVYSGPEFISLESAYSIGLQSHQTDLAHQFSNRICAVTGQKLKELHRRGKYSKVELKGIKMKTMKMDGKGEVIYTIEIPIISVSRKKAYTSFDHRGGWRHRNKMKKKQALIDFKEIRFLEAVEKNTRGGLQEFWIQFRK